MKRERDRSEFEVAARERTANRALYEADPQLARELGYVPNPCKIRFTALQRAALQSAQPRFGFDAGSWFGVGGGFFSGHGRSGL